MATKRIIPDSELIINDDGSVFHLHIKPEQLTDNIIVCGDPARVNMIASHFDTRTFEVQSREFHTIGGTFRGVPVMALSHGIGPDNIDIVMTELDALANVDFATREVKAEHRTLSIVRVGTSGGLQPEVPVGTRVIAATSVGFDGVLNYYANRNQVADLQMERSFCEHVQWNKLLATPYFVNANAELVQRIGRDDMVRGITISAVGFYGPQGRYVRMPLAEPELNARIETWQWTDGRKITNYEMESAPLQGLCAMMGHKAMTVCSIIANRVATNANTNYKNAMSDLVADVLDRMIPAQ